MKINVLHIDECPNWELAGRLIEEVLTELADRRRGRTDVVAAQ